MSLPPLAPIPPANVRLTLAPEEWAACLEAWVTLAELTLRLPAKDLAESQSGHNDAHTFLRSFYRESASSSPTDETLRTPKAHQLQRLAFKLACRLLTSNHHRESLLDWTFLADFCQVHVKSPALGRLMSRLWKDDRMTLEPLLQPQKSKLTAQLESRSLANLSGQLQGLASVMRVCPDIATVLMTGTDFMDALVSYHARETIGDARRTAAILAYLGLESLLKVEPQNVSMLSDHLYSLKASADKASTEDTLLAQLVTNTPLVRRLRAGVTGNVSERLSRLLDALDIYRTSSIARPRKQPSRWVDKGKAKASSLDGDLHMHLLSLVTQVQDLFPDLGSGFIMKLLDEYSEDVEQVTAHLLEDSLPAHLRELDRTQEAPSFSAGKISAVGDHVPRSTPRSEDAYVPSRRNVFDDDEFDRLEMDTARLHIGKRQDNPAANQKANKASILSALAAFDSDDDERDDTYDVDDVGGTVDTAHPDGEPAPTAAVRQAMQEETDAALFKVYKSSPELFGRTFDVRRGQARGTLKAETGMTDEAIEGWAVMLQRNPKQLARLEAKLGSGTRGFDGRQTELGKTSFRESETEDSDVPNAPRGGFRGRGRGRGRGGRGGGRGGHVAGPSNDAATAQAQRRKEESKGSRANHNRRDQRARKMARGGFSG